MLGMIRHYGGSEFTENNAKNCDRITRKITDKITENNTEDNGE